MADLLLIEDDPMIAESLGIALTQLGHHVRCESTGEAALAVLPAAPVDLAIVDVMLPGIDGFEICRRVRATSDLPVLLLTARGDSVDIVAGLECGADDYVVKPVDPRVLDARIKTILRRVAPAEVVSRPNRPADPVITVVGPLVVNESAMVVTRDGVPLSLTPTELRLLFELLRHRGQVLTRRTLLERVWDYGFAGDARLVDSAVQRLRTKIEQDSANPTTIVTVRGVGYRLDG